jgi:hypothetical protein
MEITVTITIPDVRPDVAAFAAQHGLALTYGDYEAESEDGDGMDYALLVSIAPSLEQQENAEELWAQFQQVVGEDDIDQYTGEEYWAVFHDRASLNGCITQFGKHVTAEFPDTRFEYAPFWE